MDFTQLRNFCAIIEYGSISKAAEALFVTQPAITKSLRRLEEELGISLFDREGKKLVLNDAGKLCHAHAERILAEADALNLAMAEMQAGNSVVRIASEYGIFYEYLLPELVSTLSEAAEVLPPTPENVSLNALRNAGVTLLISRTPVTGPGLACTLLFRDRILIRVPKQHPLAAKPKLLPSDLETLHFSSSSNVDASTITVIQECLRSNGVALNIEINHPSSFNSYYISKNAYFAFTTTVSTSYRELPSHVVRPVDIPGLELPYYAVYTRQNKRLVAPILRWLTRRMEQSEQK